MIRKSYAETALFAILPLLISSPAVEATSSRVFVAAKTGNDANACNSVTTPCQTFAGAITQVVASGEIIVLESGGYGPVTINKAVTIDAPDGIVAFIHPHSGDAVTIGAGGSDTVILRGLTLNGGANNGITVNTVGQLFVERCTITAFGNDGTEFFAPGSLFMRDDDVRECAGDGVFLLSAGSTAQAVIRNSGFHNNGNGVEAASGSNVSVIECVAAGNTRGFVADTLGLADAVMTLDHVQAVSNGKGVYALATDGKSTTIRLANSLITNNGTGLSFSGGTILGSSPGTSVVSGNGTDSDGALGAPITLQ